MNIKQGVVILSALACVVLLTADTFKSKSTKSFDRVLKKHDMVVALFYKEDKEVKRDKALSRRIDSLERTFRRVAEEHRYKDAKVSFIRVNTAKRELEDLAREYGVKTLPTILLIQDGQPMRGAVLQGFINTQMLRSFIDEYFGGMINMRLEERAERKRRRAQDRGSYTYFGYGYGYGGYPYYGYYGAPYGGVGFGFTF